MFRRVQSGTGRRDAGVGRHARHFREHQPGAAHRPAAQVHQVVIADCAVVRGILRHRRHDNPVLQHGAAQFERRQHRRNAARGCRRRQRQSGLRKGALGNPVFILRDIAGIAHAQIFVRQALAAGQHRVGELLRLHAGVTPYVLEPFHRIARGALDLDHFDGPHFLISGHHFLDGTVPFEAARQFDRIFERQLGAGTDRKMRRMHGVAHQHHRYALVVDAVPVHPIAADNPGKLDPRCGAAQVRRIAQQRIVVQVFCEQFFAEGDRLFATHLVEAGFQPHVFGRFDDEGRGVAVVLVGMGLEPAVFGFFEGKREGVEFFPGAEPDEAAQPGFDIRLIGGGIARANPAVQAVGCDHQVGVILRGCRLVIRHVGFKDQLDAELFAALLQDVQQALAADAAKTVAAGGHGVALEVDVDIVPVVERLQDGARGRFIGIDQVTQGLVGKDNAPAEGIVRTIAFDHGDFVGRILFFHQQAKIQTRRAASYANNLHSRSLVWWCTAT